MPNIAYNNVVIMGSKEEMKPFTDRVDDIRKQGLFRTFYPVPKELQNTTSPVKEKNQELIEKYGFDNWYDWSNYHYGTKWGDGVRQDGVPIQVIENNNQVIMRIETDSAWNPITQGLRYLVSRGSSTSVGSPINTLRIYNLASEEQFLWCSLTIDSRYHHKMFHDDHDFNKENGYEGFIEKIKDSDPGIYEDLKEVFDYEVGGLWKLKENRTDDFENYMNEIDQLKEEIN